MTKTMWFKPQTDTPRSIAGQQVPTDSTTTGEPINHELKEHALASDWTFRSAAAVLHEWATRFNAEFRLGLETPAVAVARLPIATLGTYHHGRNSLGVRHEITLNAKHLTRPLAEQLITLLHEQLHQWQEQYGNKGGKNGYHNQQFRIMAKRFGLVVDQRGHHACVEPGPFTQLLARYNVDTRMLPLPDEQPSFVKRPRGTSKLKLWTCTPGCTKVRCAVQLRAKCLKCGAQFVREDDGEA